MKPRRWDPALLCLWLALAAFATIACGPPDLPGFANPPPYDAGADTEDAGASDASRD